MKVALFHFQIFKSSDFQNEMSVNYIHMLLFYYIGGTNMHYTLWDASYNSI